MSFTLGLIVASICFGVAYAAFVIYMAGHRTWKGRR